MGLFRKSGEAHALSIAMTAVRLGDRLLQIGCVDPALLGAISSKVGLSGRACVAVSGAEMAARARRGAERAGVLIEIEQTDFAKLLFPDASFDLVVIDSTDGMLGSMSPSNRDACLREASRVLAGRCRVVVIESASRPSLAGLLRRPALNPSYQASGGSLAALTAARFRAVRLLAERGGLSFVEGTK